VLVGPKSNPAGIKGMKDVTEAFKAIMAKATLFISRDDRIFGRPPPSISTETKDLGIARSVNAGRCAEHGAGVERVCITQGQHRRSQDRRYDTRTFALTSTTASSFHRRYR
jgi:ABC-type tungstate transport system permease subunit